MHPFDLIWVFFIIAALQPVLRQKFLLAARQKLIARIEQQRGSRLIILIHRQETMSLLGFPFFRFIDINDSEEVLRAIHMTDPKLPLDLVLHTPGGLVLASLQIARAVKEHPGRVTVFVPHHAMSGGTLIALSADEIIMSPHAVLGPVDPQLGKYPAASLLSVLEQKPLEKVDDETLIMADMGKKAIQQVHDCVLNLVKERLPEERARELAQALSEGRWTHDYPIEPEEALKLGLPVTTDMPEDILRLMSLYPQPVRRQPSVEYLPVPHRGKQKS